MYSIGSLEFRSICIGIEVSNEIIKRNNIEIAFAKSVCPGKFIIIFSGDAAEVQSAVNLGMELGSKSVVSYFIINRVHEEIINALTNKYKSKDYTGLAVGVMENSKICSGIKALDKALKSADVRLIKMQLAFAIGGKLVYIISGSVSDVEYAIDEATKILKPSEIIATSIITSPSKELIDKII